MLLLGCSKKQENKGSKLLNMPNKPNKPNGAKKLIFAILKLYETTKINMFKLGLSTVWNPGMARCQEMSTLPAGYIPQRKVTSASSSGSLGFIVCVKCCRMVDSVPRWRLSLSWPLQSDHLLITDQMIPPLGWEHSHGKTQYIPGKQVLVRS